MKTPTVTKPLLIAAGASLLVVILIAAIFLHLRASTDAPTIETATVARGSVRQTVQATASVLPEHKLEIIPSMAGRAETVEVDMGQKVKQGQVLVWMSSSERASMLDAARAKGAEELKFWQDVYKPTAVVAPLDGTIISRNVVPGQTVTTTTNVFVMSDRLIIEADLDETDLGKVALDQKVESTLDAFPGHELTGRVYKIAYSSVTVNNVTTYKVDILLDTIPDFMRSGMTANVTIVTARHDNVLTIPSTAIQSGNNVYVLDPATKQPQPRPVKIGLNDGKNAEVTSGLSEGEAVVTSSYKLVEASANSGFSLMPKMPKRKAGGGGPPPP